MNNFAATACTRTAWFAPVFLIACTALASDSKSAAIVITLEPGAHTLHATANADGAPNESILAVGEVLLKIYVVEP